MNGLQLGEHIPGAGDRLDARPPVVLLEGAQRQRHVLRMVLGVEHTDRRVPALGRGAKPAVCALEHDRQGGQIVRTLHQIVGGSGLEQADRGVGVARGGHENHRHFEPARLDGVQQIETGPVGEAIVREHHIHVADRDALDRLGHGAHDRELDVRRVTHEVTVGRFLIGGITLDVEHADGVHGVFGPLVP